MRTFSRFIFSLVVLMAPAMLVASTISIDFEGQPDGTILTNQYPGVTFSNTIILTAGISLNEFEFPPRSGINIVSDNGGPMIISFSSAVQSFGGYFTYAEPLTLKAFGAGNNLLASATSLFSNNEALSGVSGSGPNEFLQLSTSGGISFVTITGDPGGGSFVLDDAAYTAAAAGVPEPSTLPLLLGGALILLGLRPLRSLFRLKPFFRQFLPWCRWLTLVVILSVGGASLVWGAQSIVSPTAFPPAIPVNNTSVVTVKAQVGPDQSLITSSVNLVSLDASGPILLGSLYDDGTHGDSVAGDSVYTGQFSFTESSAGTIQLIVTAAFRGSLRRVASNTFSLGVFTPISASDAHIPVAVEQQAQALFNTIQAQSGDAAARTAVLAFLQQQPGVAGARLASDNLTIWITYVSGLRSVFSTFPPGFHGGKWHGLKRGPVMAKGAVCAGMLMAPQLAVNVSSSPSSIIFDPFPSEFPEGADINGLLTPSCTGAPTYLPSTNASVDSLTSLTNYSTIALITHGVLGPAPQGSQNSEEPVICTGEPYSQAAESLHAPAFALGWLQICSLHNTIGVLPEFISFYQPVVIIPETCDVENV